MFLGNYTSSISLLKPHCGLISYNLRADIAAHSGRLTGLTLSGLIRKLAKAYQLLSYDNVQ
jgi:hypothetical protein